MTDVSKSRLWNVFTVGLVLAILAVGWFLVISPKRTTAADLRTTASDTEANNLSTEAQIRQLKLEQKQLPAQRAKIEEIKTQLPPSPDQPALIRQLTADASRADVVLSAITPAALQGVPEATGVSFMPLTLSVVGTYANVKTFLDSLEEDKRAIMVTGLNVATSQDDADLLTVGITARAFVAAPPSAATTTTDGTGATGTTDQTGTPDSSATTVN